MRNYLIAAAILASGIVHADTPAAATAAVGTKIDNVAFKDIRYLPRTLDDFDKPAKKKGYVLFFMTNSCPLAQRYLGKIIELEKNFGPKGIQFAGVNVSAGDGIMEIAAHALDYEAYFPMVKDMTGATAKKLGIMRTPEVVFLDADRVVRYRGRVDDQYRLGGERPQASRDDLKAALEEYLDGKPIATNTTQAEGCAVTLPEIKKGEAAVTYSEHVAPILDKHCVTCHRQDGGAPMAFTAYKKTADYSDMIMEVTQEGRMPPWYADPKHGKFTNARQLSHEEQAVIAQWHAAGAPEGDAAKRPPLPTFPDTQFMIEPDVVIEAKNQVVLPATGIIDYKYIFLPYEFTEDTWVQGIEIKASNPRVLHHANLFYSPHGLDFKKTENFLTGTVPGGMPADLKDGQAFFITKGSRLGLQCHYVTTGKMETDRPMVALRFAKEPVKKRLYYKIVDNPRFEIEPYNPAYPVLGKKELEDDATVTGFFGHLHLRGRDMTFTAAYADGKRETLMRMPNYNFEWQLAYYCEPDSVKLPKGTKVECLTHFDNSAFNPYNPDPAKTVTYGAQTFDEMMQGFFFYTKDGENLNIACDPKTGHALEKVASAK